MTIVSTTDFKSICDEFLANAKANKSKVIDLLTTLNEKLPGVGHNAHYKRFRSIYRKTMAQAIAETTEPSHEEVVLEVLKCETVDELWQVLKVANGSKRAFFDKHFGVSNFQRAKAKCILSSPATKYEPSIDENLSLVCSQVLGDGSYNQVRGAITLSHGEKQFQYAYAKAAMFNKAFPATHPAGNTKLMNHTQGHKYAFWYSGRLPDKICKFIEASSWKEKMDALTPLGICLYFLDDGHVNLDFQSEYNTYASIHIPFGKEEALHLQKILASYGVGSTISKSVSGEDSWNLKVGTVAGAASFYKNFLEPFLDIIPECMKYKCSVKI